MKGLAAAATGPNKKVRTKALALSVLLAAAHEMNISNEALRNAHPELAVLNEASNMAYAALDTPPPEDEEDGF